MKICVMCKNFEFDMGSPDLSDVTPGNEASIGCQKGIWQMSNFNGTLQEFRESILRAKDCEYFKQINIEE